MMETEDTLQNSSAKMCNSRWIFFHFIHRRKRNEESGSKILVNHKPFFVTFSWCNCDILLLKFTIYFEFHHKKLFPNVAESWFQFYSEKCRNSLKAVIKLRITFKLGVIFSQLSSRELFLRRFLVFWKIFELK